MGCLRYPLQHMRIGRAVFLM
uniref:Uncharacterized protein n=1 Tax=Physcomitrium patens TaxID=3218 RepID=A0A2K1KKL3_PHYPA|nr:hypothetical protein PHYPA_007980 [Physcomitrium patens]